jgi:hypothetical protein
MNTVISACLSVTPFMLDSLFVSLYIYIDFVFKLLILSSGIMLSLGSRDTRFY